MADNISWTLTANTSSVTAAMQTAVAAVNTGTNAMVQSFGRTEKAHDSLLRSNHRVAGQLGSFSQMALANADSTGLWGIALEKLSRILNLPLGPLIGLVIGGVAIKSVIDFASEFKKLNKEADELARKDLTQQKTEELEAIKKKAEEVSKAMQEQEKSYWALVQRGGSELLNTQIGGDNMRGRGGPSPRSIGSSGSQSAEDRTWERFRPQREAFAKQQAEAYHKARLEAIPAEVDAEIARRHKQEAIEAAAHSKNESLKFSLEELAKKGRDTAPGDDSTPGAGKLARRALKEEELAKEEMLKEHYGEAIRHQGNADAIKNSITPLKDDAKDFLNALDRWEVAKAQLSELKRISFKRI